MKTNTIIERKVVIMNMMPLGQQIMMQVSPALQLAQYVDDYRNCRLGVGDGPFKPNIVDVDGSVGKYKPLTLKEIDPVIHVAKKEWEFHDYKLNVGLDLHKKNLMPQTSFEDLCLKTARHEYTLPDTRETAFDFMKAETDRSILRRKKQEEFDALGAYNAVQERINRIAESTRIRKPSIPNLLLEDSCEDLYGYKPVKTTVKPMKSCVDILNEMEEKSRKERFERLCKPIEVPEYKFRPIKVEPIKTPNFEFKPLKTGGMFTEFHDEPFHVRTFDQNLLDPTPQRDHVTKHFGSPKLKHDDSLETRTILHDFNSLSCLEKRTNLLADIKPELPVWKNPVVKSRNHYEMIFERKKQPWEI